MNQRAKSNWLNVFLTKYLFNWFTLAINMVLLGLIVLLVIRAFTISPDYGIQSIAATVIPLVVIGFLKRFGRNFRFDDEIRRSTAVQILQSPIVGIVLSAVWGFILMWLVTQYGSQSGDRPPIPFAQLIISSTFIGLVNFSGTEPTKSETYYTGIVLGFLVYIFLNGFPF